MYRFKTVKEYDEKLDQLTEEIQGYRDHHVDPHMIIDCEIIKLSYIVEKEDFISEELKLKN